MDPHLFDFVYEKRDMLSLLQNESAGAFTLVFNIGPI